MHIVQNDLNDVLNKTQLLSLYVLIRTQVETRFALLAETKRVFLWMQTRWRVFQTRFEHGLGL